MSEPTAPVLELDDVEAGYGQAALVLRGLSVRVQPGEVVCLVGPNGAGKSTVLRVASGLLRPSAGRVRLNGTDVTGRSPQKLLALGLVHVMQGHSVFPEMTVGENVVMGGYSIGSRALARERLDAVREHFPLVRDRWKTLAGLLSGGQQKMVEFARSMMLDPQILLLDEPSCGLEPRAVATVFAEIDRLRGAGKAILLVEQNARSALRMSDRGCVLDLGRVAIDGPAPALLDDPQLGSLYLGAAPGREALGSPPPA
ncbi:MAG: ABC transporter ATP-binding protein [Candidatus Limnocylindria bacterium]